MQNQKKKTVQEKKGLVEALKKVYLKLRYHWFLKKYGETDYWALDQNGFQVLYSTADMHSKRLFYPHYEKTIYEPVATRLFFSHVTTGSTVLDIGGHLGYFTCLAGKIASGGKVHTFEADPQCISLIHKNLSINSLSNVTVNNLAVSDHNRHEKFPALDYPNPGLSMNPNVEKSFLAKATTIDLYVEENKIDPDFVKIDVEGAEFKVLSGMRSLLKRETLKLLIEIHVDRLKKNFSTDYRDILALLAAEGFTLYHIDSHRNEDSAIIAINEYAELTGNTMIWCTKP